MRLLNIKSKILIITLGPTILISSTISAYFLQQYKIQLDNLFATQCLNLIEKIEPISQIYIEQNDIENLQQIANSVLEEDNVRAIVIYNKHKQALAHAGPHISSPNSLSNRTEHNQSEHNQTKQSRQNASNNIALFSRPIDATNYSSLNVAENSSPSQEAIGWIEIEFNSLRNSLAFFKALSFVSLVLLISWLIYAFIAFRTSSRASDTLQNLINATIAVREGKLNTHINSSNLSEFKNLESEFNAMIRAIKTANQELQLNVERATEDVRETLETIEIQNIELDMARKEALEASRIKSEFLANMSHEIRTPLNGIIGFTKLLLKSKLNARQKEQVQTIQKSSDGLLAIINDILDFSKIEAGKLVLDHSPLNLRELAEEVLTLLAPLAQEKNLEEILIIYADVPANLISDPLRLKQILINLVNNAIKFSDQGSIVVRIMLEDLGENHAHIRVSVSDFGIGLSDEEQKDLFQAFNQADSNNLNQYGGSGLGLVISKHLTEQMGGEIGLNSKQGEGSTFWFTFRAELDQLNYETLDPGVFENFRIALFDSNDTVRLSLSHMLQKAQIKHEEFSQLDYLYDTLELAQQSGNSHHAVIIGLNHRFEGNPEVLQILTNIERQLDIRCLVLTNTSYQTSYQNQLEHLSSAYLTKPVQFKKLIVSLSDVLASRSSKHLIDNFDRGTNAGDFSENKKLNVLAVDDNPTNLKLVCAFLEDMNFNASGCNSGQKAIQLHEENNYDIILMDIRMPKLDGIETTRLIRANEAKGKHTPIIALTAHALANERTEILTNGMDDYITKPINESQLQHIIQKWVPSKTDFTPSPISNKQHRETETFVAHNGLSMEDFPNQVIDLEEGVKLAGGKKALANEMLTMLFSTLNEDKKSLLDCKDDNKTLLDAVHKLHGATKYCGVPNLRFYAQKLETILKLEQTEQFNQAFTDLLNAIDEVYQWSRDNQYLLDSNSTQAMTELN